MNVGWRWVCFGVNSTATKIIEFRETVTHKDLGFRNRSQAAALCIRGIVDEVGVALFQPPGPRKA